MHLLILHNLAKKIFKFVQLVNSQIEIEKTIILKDS